MLRLPFLEGLKLLPALPFQVLGILGIIDLELRWVATVFFITAKYANAEALTVLALWRAGIRGIVSRVRVGIVFYAFGLDWTRSFVEVRD